MKKLSFAVLVTAILSFPESKASPAPPAPECHTEVRILKDLGKKSLLHKSIRETPKSHRPFQCADPKTWPSTQAQFYKVRVESSAENPNCPKAGSEREVFVKEPLKVSGTFKAILRYVGDECTGGELLTPEK